MVHCLNLTRHSHYTILQYPNVEFNFRRDKKGELRQGVYVKLAKDSKDPGFEGVKQHEELLVSYGKSYWRSRHSDLTEFVYRYPEAKKDQRNDKELQYSCNKKVVMRNHRSQLNPNP